MNSNQELLDWAVENIKEWDLCYDSLFADKTVKVFYGSQKDEWTYEHYGYWTSDNARFTYATNHMGKALEYKPQHPQVITKKDWLEAKKEKEDMSNEFSLKDLKTGHRVTMDNGEVYTVFLNADLENCDGSKNVLVCTEGSSWCNLEDFTEDLFLHDKSIVEVRSFWAHDLNRGCNGDGQLLWERPAQETPEQAKQRELREQYEATKQQLEELGKQLGIE